MPNPLSRKLARRTEQTLPSSPSSDQEAAADELVGVAGSDTADRLVLFLRSMVITMAGEKQAAIFGRMLPRMAQKLRAMDEAELTSHVRQLALALGAVADGETITVEPLPGFIDAASELVNDDEHHDDGTDEHDAEHAGDAWPAVASA